MDLESYVAILTALVGALGIKEVWKIIKKKVDHSSNLEEKQLDFTHQVIRELKDDNEKLQRQLNKQQQMMVEHEKKIAELLTINKQLRLMMDACAEKMDRMEKRILTRAKTSSAKKRGRPSGSTNKK